MYETSKIVFFPGDPEHDGPQQKQQKKWSWWTLVVSDNDRNQRTGGGRGQIARHTTRRVQADADSARPSLLMDASPFGVSMCNALIFFFSFPGRGTGQRAAHRKVRRWFSYMYPPLPCSLPSFRLSRRSPSHRICSPLPSDLR